ncbi:hypothetical protein LguiA_012507 [Lonicera macranthoides]
MMKGFGFELTILCLKGTTRDKDQNPGKESCTKIVSQSSKAIKELSKSIKTMTQPSLCEPHLANLRLLAKTQEPQSLAQQLSLVETH